MKFRAHRGGLAESMATVIEVQTRAELEKYIVDTSAPFERQLRSLIAENGLYVRPYGYDERIGWDTHIVILQGYGVLGFTDGDLPDAGR
jgi:hypothetical protein